MKKKQSSKKSVVVRKKTKVARQKKVSLANPIAAQQPVVGSDEPTQSNQTRMEGEIGSTQSEEKDKQ